MLTDAWRSLLGVNAGIQGLSYEDPWLAAASLDGSALLVNIEQPPSHSCHYSHASGHSRALPQGTNCRRLQGPGGAGYCVDLAEQCLAVGSEAERVRCFDFTGARAAADRAAAAKAARNMRKAGRRAVAGDEAGGVGGEEDVWPGQGMAEAGNGRLGLSQWQHVPNVRAVVDASAAQAASPCCGHVHAAPMSPCSRLHPHQEAGAETGMQVGDGGQAPSSSAQPEQVQGGEGTAVESRQGGRPGTPAAALGTGRGGGKVRGASSRGKPKGTAGRHRKVKEFGTNDPFVM